MPVGISGGTHRFELFEDWVEGGRRSLGKSGLTLQAGPVHEGQYAGTNAGAERPHQHQCVVEGGLRPVVVQGSRTPGAFGASGEADWWCVGCGHQRRAAPFTISSGCPA